jgi:hypothetical protein
VITQVRFDPLFKKYDGAWMRVRWIEFAKRTGLDWNVFLGRYDSFTDYQGISHETFLDHVPSLRLRDHRGDGEPPDAIMRRTINAAVAASRRARRPKLRFGQRRVRAPG